MDNSKPYSNNGVITHYSTSPVTTFLTYNSDRRQPEISVETLANQKPNKHLQRVATANQYLWLALFSYAGVLTRCYLTVVSNVPTSQTEILLPLLGAGYFLPNIFGCFVMGFAVKIGPDRFANYLFLYLAITTGFCGCCTTFATWQAMIAKQFLHAGWLVSLLQLLIVFSTSLTAFYFGNHLANPLCIILDSRSEDCTHRSQKTKPWVHIISLLMVTFLFLLLTALLLYGAFWDNVLGRRNCWIAACAGPFGAYLRYWLSKLNLKFPTFPLGTFIANVSASALNMIFYAASHYVSGSNAIADPSGKDLFNFWVLSASSTGFMGSLSTVSTWVNELTKLSAKSIGYAYMYGIMSVLTAQVLCLALGGGWVLSGRSIA